MFSFQNDDCSSKGAKGRSGQKWMKDTCAGLLGTLTLWISLGAAVAGARCLVITVLLLPEMRSRGEATELTEGIVFQTGDQNPRVDQKNHSSWNWE